VTEPYTAVAMGVVELPEPRCFFCLDALARLRMVRRLAALPLIVQPDSPQRLELSR
jgi:hypothetical protein